MKKYIIVVITIIFALTGCFAGSLSRSAPHPDLEIITISGSVTASPIAFRHQENWEFYAIPGEQPAFVLTHRDPYVGLAVQHRYGDLQECRNQFAMWAISVFVASDAMDPTIIETDAYTTTIYPLLFLEYDYNYVAYLYANVEVEGMDGFLEVTMYVDLDDLEYIQSEVEWMLENILNAQGLPAFPTTEMIDGMLQKKQGA